MKKAFSLVLVAIVGVGVLAAPVAAGGDREVERRGSCSGASDWKFKVKKDDGKLEAEYEVDQNVNGHKWRVTLRHDGKRYFRGKRVTQPPSGSFEIERKVRNHLGTDKFRGRARNLKTDEVCRGRVSF
ncbi:MAG: hypothetical protein ACRDK3_17700 [Actinomycetota bacterium]